jgi:hypothetical protein
MNIKFPFTWIVLLGLMSSITIGVLYEESKNDESRFIFGSAHEHASISIKIFGEEFDLAKQSFQLQSPFIHLENFDGHVIHRHSEYVTIGYLFDTLNLGLTKDCLVIPDGEKICSNDEYSLKFYINQKKVRNLQDYLIFDGDYILISYGSESQDEIKLQLKELKDRGFPFKLREQVDNYLKF